MIMNNADFTLIWTEGNTVAQTAVLRFITFQNIL